MRHILTVLAFFTLTGCATIFQGYDSTLEIKNAPSDLRVTTSDGVDLPVREFIPVISNKDAFTGAPLAHSEPATINRAVTVRSGKSYVLVLQTKDSVKRIEAIPKINIWWFVLDVVCGGLPAIVDAYTGNWNYFEKVEFK